MRSSTTTLDTGRSRVRTGITPSANIRVQRATDTGGRAKPSNSNSSKSNSNVNSSNTGISHRRISQFSSTDIPSIPPRTRQTNGGRINLSNSQGIHTNINANTGISQTRNQQRALNQTLPRTTPQISQTQSRTTNSIHNGNTNNNSPQAPRTPNRTRTNTTTNNSTNSTNRNTEEGRLFPRAPPPAEAARRNLHRSTRNSENTSSTNRLISNNANTSTQQNSNSHSATVENGTRVPNYTRPQIQSRTIAPPRNPPAQYSRPSPSISPGEPIVPAPNTHHNLNDSQNRSLNHQPSPSDNVGSTQEPQVLIRSSTNSVPNRTTTTNSNTARPQPSTNPNPHLTLNFNVQSNTLNTRNSNNGNLSNTSQNTNQPQIRTPNTNAQQQHNTRPILINTGTRTAPNTDQNPNPNRNLNARNHDPAYNEEDGHLGLFDELFAILDNFPINIIPLIPVMFDTSFGPFLESVIPLYLAHYERNQIMRAIDESMREAENPKPSPPKEVKLIKHMVDKEDINSERQCLVCLSDFVAGEQTIMLKCGHFFHKDCLMPWLAQNHTCPTCRANIDETLIESDKGVMT